VAPAENSVSAIVDDMPGELAKIMGKEALLLTNFKSFDQFKQMIQIKYHVDKPINGVPPTQVDLTHKSGAREVTSILKSGISEADLLRARDGNLWERIKVGLSSPYAALHKKELMYIEDLGRRKPWIFGKGDVAFYDLAETMVFNISEDDLISMTSEELSGKGYLNTFNHITAQAFMTSIFSERFADFVADVHERHRMPELITGNFSADQINDLEDGPVDNYLDMINNEWGQELGKLLREKYSITRKTYWTPALLSNYLNDIQSYHSWAFHIGFRPFRPSDDLVRRFASKLNKVLDSERQA
jgi:hypothetical protein